MFPSGVSVGVWSMALSKVKAPHDKKRVKELNL